MAGINLRNIILGKVPFRRGTGDIWKLVDFSIYFKAITITWPDLVRVYLDSDLVTDLH
jgi:hypothetical protein